VSQKQSNNNNNINGNEMGARDGAVVEALRYKLKGSGIDSL
jgi:hypothetical protein